MKILLIRHGLTAGNLERRYIGRTDEPLCSEGIIALQALHYPRCEYLLCSPMQRCLQTADILFPGQLRRLHPDLRECDFGDFEGKTYLELSGNASYQRWIDSGGQITFPHGEDPQAFRERCADAFKRLLDSLPPTSSAAVIAHGGTIMAVLDAFSAPHRDYFDWQCPNGGGYACEWDGQHLFNTEKL